MIRNVVLGRLPEDVSDAVRANVGDAAAAISVLPLEGRVSSTWGWDKGLRAGGWSFAIVSDWADAHAYRVYDLDLEHNRLRAIIVAACADVARVQFDI